ncbi:hypothetical protein [Porphyromonas sp.]|uniref:hypothetical protein n=1 Tax=Porphyromonas sp. TaxID=1924944 RepID=UPI0026DC8747|nr:hypothetical protein [Porphyromonas sp.]MDO4771369.1 hypothetical protein [Porphyromonas sp.]
MQILGENTSSEEMVEYDKLIPDYNELIEKSKRDLPFKAGIGLVDKTGTKIILPNSEEQTASSEYTHCVIKGRVYGVKALRKQEETPDFDGRETVRNFDKMSGYLYEIISKEKISAPEGDDIHVFMCNEDFISAHTIVPMIYQMVPIEEGDETPQYTDVQIRDSKLFRAAIKKRYKADISEFSVKSVSEDGKIRTYSVTVDTKAPIALGLTVVYVDEQLIFGEDFAVQNEYSTWRADDEGHYEGHTPDFAFTDKNGTLNLFFSSFGAEGINFFTMYRRGDRLIQRSYMTYFYVAPM